MAEANSFGSEQDTGTRAGRMLDLARMAHKIVTVNSWVQPGEVVVILCDHEVSSLIVEALAQQVYVVGGIPLTVRMPPQTVHGQELPAPLAHTLREAQVIYGVVSRSISHTIALREARKAGVRYIGFSNITEDAFLHGAAEADPRVLNEIGVKVRDKLLTSEQIRVTSELGMDVTFSITGRRVRVGDSLVPHDEGFGLPSDNIPDNGRMFPDGEVFCCPLEDSVEGTIVVDRWVQGVGVLTEPMTWQFEGGKCVGITGGLQAGFLNRLLNEEGDEYSWYLGEFAVGTNPMARPDGNPHREGKKILGAVHFALGTGLSTGGIYKSTLHLDGSISPPKIYVDDDLFFDEGRLLA
jgi:leucyl aminopeptidase (aminopeptidase T)